MSSTKMSQRIEDYAKHGLGVGRGNLTDLQIRFQEWWKLAAVIQVGRTDFTAMCFGFKGGKSGADGRVEPLSMDQPIRPADSVRLLTLVPIAKRLYMPPKLVREGRYRIHFGEHACQVRNNELTYGGWADAGQVSHAQYFGADAARRPLQDHQVYTQRKFEKSLGTVGAAIAEAQGADRNLVLTAPHDGTLAIVRNDLHLRITINGYDVYRFLLEDESSIEFVKTDGMVRTGDELLKLTDGMTYLVGDFVGEGRERRPKMDRIAGDILSATHREFALAFAVHALEKTTDYSIKSTDDHTRPTARPIEEYFPICMPLVSLEVLRTRRAKGWKPNELLQEMLREAVSPDAVGTDNAFVIKAPAAGKVTSVDLQAGFKRVTWVGEGGLEHQFAIPRCSELYEGVSNGAAFEAGDAIGDYVPREYYVDYKQLCDVADEAISKIEDLFFEERYVVRSGERKWSGNGVLVDGRVAGLLSNFATSYFVDISPLASYIDSEYGIAMCPPVEYDIAHHGFTRHVNGAAYDFTPVGKQFDTLQAGINQMLSNTGRGLQKKKASRKPRRKQQK